MLHFTIKDSEYDNRLSRMIKLRRWAKLVRRAPFNPELMHRLEYLPVADLERIRAYYTTSMGIATQDPVFQSQGLALKSSIADVMRFFEITQAQLHEFSCDCGGEIDKETMAQRIEHLGKQG